MDRDPDFITVAFTSPDRVAGEAGKIVRLFESGVDAVHVRKPDHNEEELSELIESIPSPLRRRLRLHDHFGLCARYGLAGVHLNSRNPMPPAGVTSVTASCHTVAELHDAGKYEYVTLSPIFDSISKSGYRSAFDPDLLAPSLRLARVVALGGVTPAHLLQLREKGFYGAALLGYIWSGDFDTAAGRLARAIRELRH